MVVLFLAQNIKIIIIIIITVNLYSAFFCKFKNPKRAACASLVEREQKGFEVVLLKR